MRQRFRGKHNEEEKKQPHDGEGEHMEALPSAAKLYVNTFMHSLDLTYGFVKLLVPPPPPHCLYIFQWPSRGIPLRQIPYWSDPSYTLMADAISANKRAEFLDNYSKPNSCLYRPSVIKAWPNDYLLFISNDSLQ